MYNDCGPVAAHYLLSLLSSVTHNIADTSAAVLVRRRRVAALSLPQFRLLLAPVPSSHVAGLGTCGWS